MLKANMFADSFFIIFYFSFIWEVENRWFFDRVLDLKRKRRFCKNKRFASTGARFLRFRALEKTPKTTQKTTKKTTFCSPSILSKLKQNSTKIKVSKSIFPKTIKISIFRPFCPPKSFPKPFRNREKIDEKSMLKTKAKK